MKTKITTILIALIISALTVSAQTNVINWKVLSFGTTKAVPINGYVISEKNPDIHFAVSKTTVYKSVDGGTTWSVAAEKVGGFMFYMNKISIVLHPENPDIIYIGSLPGVMKSTDGGKTWATKKFAPAISVVLLNPNNPDEVWAASTQAGNPGGIWVSKDAGENWQQKLKNRPSSAFDADPTDFRMMYAGTGAGSFEKSNDAGLTWRSKKPQEGELKGLPAVTGIAINPNQPNVMLLSANGLGIFKSNDGGEAWIHTGHYLDREVKYNPKNPSEVWGISNPTLGALGGKGSVVHFSNDGGNVFVNTHADEMIKDMNDKYYDGKNAQFNDIYFSPDGSKVYICTTSGVIFTDSKGVE